MSVEIITYSGTKRALDFGTNGGITKTCILVVSQATALAPVNKKEGVGGQLKNSIMWKLANGRTGGFNDSEGDTATKKITPTPEAGSAYVGSALDYATYQEFGTRYMAPQPFLRPAISLVYGRDKNKVMEEIRKETERGPLGKEGERRETFK